MARRRWTDVVVETVLVVVAAGFAVPLVSMVIVSLKASRSQTGALSLDWPPSFSNYAQAWAQGGLGAALWNSLLVTVLSVGLGIVLCGFASYPLARVTRPWSRILYWSISVGLLLPIQLGMLPLYVAMRNIGLLGSPYALVIISVGTQAPFSIFLFTSFLRALPCEYEEAAVLDGCGPVRTFWSVVFPLMRPVAGTIVILNAIGTWNDFLIPQLYLAGSDQKTVAVALYSFVGQYASQWPLVFAALVITVVPVLIVYFVLQKYIIKGFSGGLKG